jgi:hypothetical protein
MPGGVITTGNHPKALWPGIHAFWGQVYNEHPEEYPDLYDVTDSDQAYEEDVEITGFGLAPVKAEGAPISYDSEIQGPVQRYTHIAYALGYKVTYEELRDNKYEVVSTRRAQANAFSIRQTTENVAAAPYNDAFTGAIFTFATGQPLVSVNQVQATGGTFSNQLFPGAPLSETALEDACIQIMGFTTDRGLNINLMPQSLHIARQQWFNANRILKSVLQNDTGNNAVNVLKLVNAFPKGIKMNHYFQNANSWFIRTNCLNGMQFFWRDRPMFDQDNDFDTKNAKAATYMRFSVGGTDPRCILGANSP